MLSTLVFRLCGIGLFVCTSLLVNAQQNADSATVLHEVIVEQSRLGNYVISKYTLHVDSMTRALASSGSLADMLRKYGYGHVRGYGPGGLASASFRGTGSSHTSVLWNGINLLSPLNGQLDLSLVPVGFIDDASIQTGGATSVYGNGSIGGTILLNNKARFNDGLTIKTFVNGGSFGSYYQDLGVSWSGKKFISSTKFFINQSDNDFKYLSTKTSTRTTERRHHNAIHQHGILQQNYWQPTKNNVLTFKLWWQDNTYEVPNSIYAGQKAEAVEKNTFWRALAGWNYTNEKFDLSYQGAFIKHDLDYRDPLISLVSFSTFDTFINNLEGNFSFKEKINLSTGINYTWEKGKADAFGSDDPTRNRLALFSAFKWKPKSRLEFSITAREEFVNGQATPIAPSVTTKVWLVKGLQVYVNASRNYRIPTFNDLYWKGAGGLGNPDLKAELSTGGEVGLQFKRSNVNDTQSLSFSTALFSNDVDDWIQWSPVTSQVWSPKNIKKVWSRGVESQASAHKNFGDVRVETMIRYSFTQATTEKLYEKGNPNELGKQLMLTPLHEGSATLRVIWKGFYANIVNSFSGKQYTDNDNNIFNALKGFDVSNVSISKALPFTIVHITFNGEVNNIFNSHYQSRQGYPMPGINFKAGITINFNKPNSL